MARATHQLALLQHLGEKAGIEQVQDRVLNAADVLIHGIQASMLPW